MSDQKEISWRDQYAGFVDPNYDHCEQVEARKVTAEFEEFFMSCLRDIPEDLPVPTQNPANKSTGDAYMFNTYMGSFCRNLTAAKDDYIKLKLAFYRRRRPYKPSEINQVKKL